MVSKALKYVENHGQASSPVSWAKVVQSTELSELFFWDVSEGEWTVKVVIENGRTLTTKGIMVEQQEPPSQNLANGLSLLQGVLFPDGQ